MASIEAVEELALKCDEELSKMTATQLGELASGLNIEQNKYIGLSKLKILKNVRAHVEHSTDEEEPEAQLTYFTNLSEAIKMLVREVDSSVADTTARKGEEVKPAEEGAEAAADPVVGTGRKEGLAELSSRSTLSRFGFEHLKREAKIQGKIGEMGDKDCISYGGLLMQLSNFKELKYTDQEIMMAVIKSMTPTLSLRRLTEAMRSTLSLSELLSLLRTHYKERRPNELYQELLNIRQGENEEAISFIWRAFELRARIQSSSDLEEDPSQRYDPRLVKSVMLSSIDSGIRDPYVRNQLSPILQTPSIEIHEISAKLQSILYTESIRRDKLGQKQSEQKVAPVTVPPSKQKPSEEDKVLNTLKSLQGQIASLSNVKTEIADLKTQFSKLGQSSGGGNKKGQGNNKAKPPVCANCEANGLSKCNHCRKCLGENHIERFCRKPKN